MKFIKLAKLVIQLALVFWVIYNTYFGWNWEAVSELEKTCDSIFSIVVKIGIFLYLLPLYYLYEGTIARAEEVAKERNTNLNN